MSMGPRSGRKVRIQVERGGSAKHEADFQCKVVPNSACRFTRAVI